MATFQVDRRLRQAQRFSDEFDQPVLFLPFFFVDRSNSKQQCEVAPFNRSFRAVAITAATFY